MLNKIAVSNIKSTRASHLISLSLPPVKPQILIRRHLQGHGSTNYLNPIPISCYLWYHSRRRNIKLNIKHNKKKNNNTINSSSYQRINPNSYRSPHCNNNNARVSSISFVSFAPVSLIRGYTTSTTSTSSQPHNNEKNNHSTHPAPQENEDMTQYNKTLYENDFKPLDKKGGVYDLSQHKGDVIVVVNVASKCGFTPQYEGLEKLYKSYKDQGLTVLGFPSNEFGKQEPGSAEEIESFCQLNYGVTFPVLAKTHVNGDNAEDIYKWLKSEQKGLLTNGIKWNFTKFIIDREGNVVSRWSPTTKPESMEDAIKAELAKPKPEAKI